MGIVKTGNVRGWEDTIFDGKDMKGHYDRRGAEMAAADLVAFDKRTNHLGSGAIGPEERAKYNALQQAKSEFNKEPPENKKQGFERWVIGELQEEAAQRGQSIGPAFQSAARGGPAAAAPRAPAMEAPSGPVAGRTFYRDATPAPGAV